ncbi:MAG: hypothetical protein ACXVPD_15525, partial [Bacteroidia bacterium]
ARNAEIQKATSLLKAMLTKRDDIMPSPEPSVFLNGVSDTAIEFRVQFWAPDIANYMDLRSTVLTDIYEELSKAGIAVPAKI